MPLGKNAEVFTRMAEGLEEPLACDKRRTMVETMAVVSPAYDVRLAAQCDTSPISSSDLILLLYHWCLRLQ